MIRRIMIYGRKWPRPPPSSSSSSCVMKNQTIFRRIMSTTREALDTFHEKWCENGDGSGVVRLCNRGDGVAVGICHIYGWNGRKDVKKGVHLLKNAIATSTDKWALYYLAMCFLNGVDGVVPVDVNQAREYFVQSCERMCGPAAYQLAIMYEKGIGVEADPDEAITYHRRAAVCVAASEYALALHDLQHGRVKEGLRWLRRASEKNHGPSLARLGRMHLHGENNVEQDPDLAISLLLRASRQGVSSAFFTLGQIYEDGTCGVDCDSDLSASYYERGAKAGVPEAMYAYGHLLVASGQSNEGNFWIERSDLLQNALEIESVDPQRAATMYEMCALDGDSTAMRHLGLMHLQGIGVEMDTVTGVAYLEEAAGMSDGRALIDLAEQSASLEEAEVYCRQAIELGIEGAEEKLLELQRRTRLRPQRRGDVNYDAAAFLDEGDSKKRAFDTNAVKRLKKLVDAGNGEAAHELGMYYTNVQKAHESAYHVFMKGVEFGNPSCMKCVGMHFEKGLYVSRDIDKAKRWYEKAGIAGDISGYARLAYMHSAQGNREKSFELWKRLLDVEFPPAYLHVSNHYRTGDVVEQDESLAVDYMRKGAEHGHLPALDRYFRWCFSSGDQSDISGLFDLVKRLATDNQMPRAMCFMGLMHCEGLHVEQDATAGFKWLLEAAKAGDVKAQTYVAMCYYHGEGTDVDHNTSEWWLRRANQNNYLPAKMCIDAMF